MNSQIVSTGPLSTASPSGQYALDADISSTKWINNTSEDVTGYLYAISSANNEGFKGITLLLQIRQGVTVLENWSVVSPGIGGPSEDTAMNITSSVFINATYSSMVSIYMRAIFAEVDSTIPQIYPFDSGWKKLTSVMIVHVQPPTIQKVKYWGDVITLDWLASEINFPEYTIFRSTSDNVHYMELNSTFDLFYYDNYDLQVGQTYYYKVGAFNSSGFVVFSEEVSLLVPGLPSAPLNVVTIPNKFGYDLTWDYPASDGGSPVTTYWIYKSSSGNASYILDGNASADRHYAALCYQPGIPCYFQVSATNVAGEGPRSDEAIGLWDVPTPPLNLTYKINDRGVELFWDPPVSDGGSPIKWYYIWRDDNIDGFFNTAVGQVTTRYFFDTMVQGGKTYYYKVTSLTELGDGKYSEVLVVDITVASNSSSPAQNTSSNPGIDVTGLDYTPLPILILSLVSIPVLRGIIDKKKIKSS